jgi:putative ABC transport system permease protein
VLRRLTLRGLWTHRRRMVGTLLAVFLGVAFLAGTLSLSDTLGAAVNNAFSTAYSHTDVMVQSSGLPTGNSKLTRGQIDGAIFGAVAGVSGVAAADPVLAGTGVVVAPDGKAVSGLGARTASTWITDPVLNPWHLVSGAAPAGTDQIVIDQATATSAGISAGQLVTIEMPQPVRVTVSGIADFGTASSSGNGSYAAFTLAGAQKYIAGGQNRLTAIEVRAQPGVSQQQLADRIAAVLPGGVQAITGQALIAQQESTVDSDFLNYLDVFLGVFAVIALAVATLSIHNTFSISAAQRSREAALLRAIGATRRQITEGLLLEAAVLGVVGAAAGLGGGVAITYGLKGVFSGLNVSLPAQGLVFTGGTIALSLLAGIVVTLAAAVSPAVRAGRVSPVEALRESDPDQAGSSRRRTVVGVVLLAIGILLAAYGAVGGHLAITGVGAAAAVAGTLTLGPRIAEFAARALGRAMGGPGSGRAPAARLAQGNAARNPKRTSGAATALIVGIAIVTLFTVFAASIKAGIAQSVDGAFTGQLVVTGKSGLSGVGFSPQAAADATAVPGVASAVGVGGGNVQIDGVSSSVDFADLSAIGSVIDLGAIHGSLGDAQFAVSSATATANGWHLGQQVTLTFQDGSTATVPLGATYSASGDPLPDYLLSEPVWAAHDTQVFDRNVFVALSPGADLAAVQSALGTATAKYAGTAVETKAQFVAGEAGAVNTLLDIIYLMLALAVVIALLGIANTLSLAVHERTREIGLLRAVGALRPQVRAMVRWESLITTMIGAVTGLVLGVFLGWALVAAGAKAGDLGEFTVPTVRLVVILLVCAACGLLAGIRPARRAARLDVLTAIAAQ